MCERDMNPVDRLINILDDVDCETGSNPIASASSRLALSNFALYLQAQYGKDLLGLASRMISGLGSGRVTKLYSPFFIYGPQEYVDRAIGRLVIGNCCSVREIINNQLISPGPGQLNPQPTQIEGVYAALRSLPEAPGDSYAVSAHFTMRALIDVIRNPLINSCLPPPTAILSRVHP